MGSLKYFAFNSSALSIPLSVKNKDFPPGTRRIKPWPSSVFTTSKVYPFHALVTLSTSLSLDFFWDECLFSSRHEVKDINKRVISRIFSFMVLSPVIKKPAFPGYLQAAAGGEFRMVSTGWAGVTGSVGSAGLGKLLELLGTGKLFAVQHRSPLLCNGHDSTSCNPVMWNNLPGTYALGLTREGPFFQKASPW